MSSESESDKRTEHMKSMTCITCDEGIFNLDGTPVAGNWCCICCGMSVHVQEGCGENSGGEVACSFCISEGHYAQEHIGENEVIVRSTCLGWDEVSEEYEALQHHQVGGPFYDKEGAPSPYESSE
jgi:hypothetical protein